MSYEEKVSYFISLIHVEDDSTLYYISRLIQKTFNTMKKIDELHANKYLDSLISIGENSTLRFDVGNHSNCTISHTNKTCLTIVDAYAANRLIHEFAHIIHIFGAHLHDVYFCNRLTELINRDDFIEIVQKIVDNEVNYLKKQFDIIDSRCKKLFKDDSYKDKNIDEMLEGLPEEFIRYMKTKTYPVDDLKVIWKDISSHLINYVYPEHFVLLSFLDSLTKGRVKDNCYGHGKEYFETHDDYIWTSEIIATYEELRFLDNFDHHNGIAVLLLGKELYDRLVFFIDTLFDKTIELLNTNDSVRKIG